MKTKQTPLHQAAFTLIELLVVIAIIALLASIVLVALNGARVKARDAKRIGDINAIGEAIQLYYNDNSAYPNCAPWSYSTDSNWQTTGCLQTALQPYIPVLPKDPLNTGGAPWNTGGYEYSYGTSAYTKEYDLVGEFEDTTNKNDCANRNWIFYSNGNGTVPVDWCQNGQSWSPYLFEDH